jgi:RNA polymerase sigma-70 factor (ECF subfamily)
MKYDVIDVGDYYIKYGPMVMRRCRSILRDDDAAFDAMQEVFIRLLVHGKNLKGDYPSSLLYRIATNLCFNELRRKRRAAEYSNASFLERIPDRISMTEKIFESDSVSRIFNGEKRSTREFAYMHYIAGMTFREIAEETGFSASGIRRRLDVLKRKIRDMRCQIL